MSVAISIKHVKKVFGETTVINDLSLNVKDGEFFTLLGPSGCGKTTLLRMIAGFNSIEGGDFYFNDKRINDLPSHKRNIGMVFQSYAIFPHLSAGDNIAFGLKERKIREPEISRRVDEILETVQISDLKKRMPGNMSGGQQQRIALARAMVINPEVLLMDEPLSNLDAKLRVEMRTAIRHLQQEAKITTMYVTHDQEEALAISDRIAVMSAGEIQQVGAPMVIYRKPANLFVATFMGQTNVLDASLDYKKKEIALGDKYRYVIDRIGSDVKTDNVKLCVRPNEFSFSDSGIAGYVTERVFFGAYINYMIRCDFGGEVLVTGDINGKIYDVGNRVFLSVPVGVVNVFDAQTEVSVMGDVERCIS